MSTSARGSEKLGTAIEPALVDRQGKGGETSSKAKLRRMHYKDQENGVMLARCGRPDLFPLPCVNYFSFNSQRSGVRACRESGVVLCLQLCHAILGLHFGPKVYFRSPFWTQQDHVLLQPQSLGGASPCLPFPLQAAISSWKVSIWTPAKAFLQGFPQVALPGPARSWDCSFHERHAGQPE